MVYTLRFVFIECIGREIRPRGYGPVNVPILWETLKQLQPLLRRRRVRGGARADVPKTYEAEGGGVPALNDAEMQVSTCKRRPKIELLRTTFICGQLTGIDKGNGPRKTRSPSFCVSNALSSKF